MSQKSMLLFSSLAFAFLILTCVPIGKAIDDTTAGTSANIPNTYSQGFESSTTVNTTYFDKKMRENNYASVNTASTTSDEAEFNKNRKAEIQAEVTARKAEFKTQLATIRDEKKQELVLNINDRFAVINKNRTVAWTKILEQISNILTKVKSRAEFLEAKGVDMTEVNAKITAAETAIAAAQTAIDIQAEKTYTIEIQDETTLREMVSQTKETVKTDLKALHTVIKTAHEAVRDAIRTLNAARPLVSPEPTS